MTFQPPPGWVAASRPPEGLVALFAPRGAGRFPHLAVSPAQGGEPRSVLTRVRASLPQLLGAMGILNARSVLSPTLVTKRGEPRVELAFTGEIGGAAFDWYQGVVPARVSGLAFTFALPRGSLASMRGEIEASLASIRRVSPP